MISATSANGFVGMRGSASASRLPFDNWQDQKPGSFHRGTERCTTPAAMQHCNRNCVAHSCGTAGCGTYLQYRSARSLQSRCQRVLELIRLNAGRFSHRMLWNGDVCFTLKTGRLLMGRTCPPWGYRPEPPSPWKVNERSAVTL
jgi:hypothetical protein